MVYFSIIIPHRNCINLLKRAVSSIPEREDIEILIIDNSIDKLPEDLFVNSRLNVNIFYSNPTKGAGAARNVGLDHASGKWLLFLDADDYFEDIAFDVFNKFRNASEELIYFKMESCYSDSGAPANRGDCYTKMVEAYLNNESNSEENIRLGYASPCAKMVSRELVERHHIRFDEVPASNDMMCSMLIGYYANAIICYDAIVYCATVTRGSLTRTRSLENQEARFEVNLRYNAFMKAKGLKRRHSIMYFLLTSWRFGVKAHIRFWKKCIHYRNNPFYGYSNWWKTLCKKFLQNY